MRNVNLLLEDVGVKREIDIMPVLTDMDEIELLTNFEEFSKM